METINLSSNSNVDRTGRKVTGNHHVTIGIKKSDFLYAMMQVAFIITRIDGNGNAMNVVVKLLKQEIVTNEI